MSGLSDAERLGMWLAENKHDVVLAARCPGGDGRILAKLCDVEGHRWVWFAPVRKAKEWFITDEIEEMVDQPTVDGEAHPDEIRALIDEIRTMSGPLIFPPEAFPETLPGGWPFAGSVGSRQIVNCPGCRNRYRVAWDGTAFSVSPAPPASTR